MSSPISELNTMYAPNGNEIIIKTKTIEINAVYGILNA